LQTQKANPNPARIAKDHSSERKTEMAHLRLWIGVVMVLACCWMLSACSEDGPNQTDGDTSVDGDVVDGDSSDGDGDGDSDLEVVIDGDKEGDGDGDALAVDWQPCPLVAGEDSDLAECAHVELPLFWEEGDPRTLSIGAKRYRAEGPAKAQLWLLQGGPGASGVRTFGPFMKELRAVLPEVDLYTLDHRGVGESNHLSCPEQEAEDSEGGAYILEAEWDDCLAYIDEQIGDGFDAYSTRNAAHDLAGYIDRTREEGVPVFVWGGSYGTYIGQRYLLLHPDQADGVILDSIHAVSVPGLGFEHYRNIAGHNLFDVCAADEICSQKLGEDPWQKLADLYVKIEDGHCSQLNADRYTLSYLLGWLTWYRPYNIAAPAMVYRIDRCDYKDMLAVVYMYNNLFNGTGDLLGLTGEWFSQVLSAQIGYSDQFWGDEFEEVDLPAYFEELRNEVMVGAIESEFAYNLYKKWPRYDEPQANTLPQTSIPVLMLQGKLDGSTPEEQAIHLTETLNGANQHYVIFPYSAHGVLSDSWMPGYTEVPTCGMQLLAQFINDPTADLDESCVDDAIGPDFASWPDLSRAIFGETDLWENAPGPMKTGQAVQPIGSLKGRIQLPLIP
jgi:pimeloyl-ACP methyl ester carboxylesterase